MRENALCLFMAASASATMAWLALYGFGWNDYDIEARPAVEMLVHGHVQEFLRLAPAYGGSLVERAPFALLPGLGGGGELAIYRMLALPCLLAGALLGVWLVARMRTERRPPLARAVALAVCVANPVTLRALELGHAEEMLGGAMCVAAVILAARSSAGRGRSICCGIIIGLAIANKQWAVLALGPVLLALPARRRPWFLASAGATAAAVLTPLALASSGAFVAGNGTLATPGATIFQPWQLWWFFGHHGALVHGLAGNAKPGYRVGPAWAGTISHPLIIAFGLAITGALWLRSRRVTPAGAPGGQPAVEAPRRLGLGRARGGVLSIQDALLALALVLLMRCVLDTWDNVYYPLPFILALLAWEVTRPNSQPPVLALLVSVLVYASFQWLPKLLSPDAQAAVFLLWSLPLAAWLGTRLLGSGGLARERSLEPERSLHPQEITVSSLGRLVSGSEASSPTSSRSSMRTPSTPGR
jgi:hypothetical protein